MTPSSDSDPFVLNDGTDKPGGLTRPVQLLPEPTHFWVAYAPRTWRFCSKPWTDIARACLGTTRKPLLDHGLPDLDIAELDDLFYLPPVDRALAKERDGLATRLAEAGIPVLMQLAVGDKSKVPDEVEGVTALYDLLRPLLATDVDKLIALPEKAVAVWPMIPGITNELDLWNEGLFLLGQRGIRVVQPQLLDLKPAERRKLAEGRGEEVYEALFHSRIGVLTERRFSVAAHREGLELFFQRPEAGLTPRHVSNRRIAAQLSLAGDLWLRLERPMTTGQGLLRAARVAESTHYDLAALVRESNLKVIDWLNLQARELVEEWVLEDRSSLVENLTAIYLETTVEEIQAIAADDSSDDEEEDDEKDPDPEDLDNADEDDDDDDD
jgi:hypothetical protein